MWDSYHVNYFLYKLQIYQYIHVVDCYCEKCSLAGQTLFLIVNTHQRYTKKFSYLNINGKSGLACKTMKCDTYLHNYDNLVIYITVVYDAWVSWMLGHP